MKRIQRVVWTVAIAACLIGTENLLNHASQHSTSAQPSTDMEQNIESGQRVPACDASDNPSLRSP